MAKSTDRSKAKPEAEAMDIEAASPPPIESVKDASAAKPAPARVKKSRPAAGRSGSLMPSDQKLEHLRLAVAAAGDADTLLTILDHVGQAGGPDDVVESIQTYRALRAAVEVTAETSGAYEAT